MGELRSIPGKLPIVILKLKEIFSLIHKRDLQTWSKCLAFLRTSRYGFNEEAPGSVPTLGAGS